MIVGNVSVEIKGSVLEVSLNTHHKGHPHALLTATDAANLAVLLSTEAAKLRPGKATKAALPPPEEDEDWSSLI